MAPEWQLRRKEALADVAVAAVWEERDDVAAKPQADRLQRGGKRAARARARDERVDLP